MNPYLINEPGHVVISFSGGRSSGYMLYRILEAHDGVLPDNVRVIFTNTGLEVEEALRFVQRCSDEWGVPITWLERRSRAIEDESKKYGFRYLYEVEEVCFDTASRDGRPMRELILARRYAPNPAARFCTVELKIRAVEQYMRQFTDDDFMAYLGIRADENRRASRQHGTKEGRQERYLPMYVDGVTKGDVAAFWRAQNFDLELLNDNGTTPMGNCSLCFLKGLPKKISIIKARPELADFWIEMEAALKDLTSGAGGTFRNDQPTYAQMKMIATSNQEMDFLNVDLEECNCTD